MTNPSSISTLMKARFGTTKLNRDASCGRTGSTVRWKRLFSQVPKMFRQPEELRRILGSATQYHTLDVGPRAPVKQPQQMKPAELPGADGGELVSYLYYLREDDPARFESIVDSLRVAFKDLDYLNFPPVAAGMLTMTWKDKNFAKPLYMHELSEGTLRFLWLVSRAAESRSLDNHHDR